jgi:hypothetical protein
MARYTLLNFENVSVSLGDGGVAARLVSYTPQQGDDPAEIEWAFFNDASGERMDDLYPLFKPSVHSRVDAMLWIQLKQRLASDFKAAYKKWRRIDESDVLVALAEAVE